MLGFFGWILKKGWVIEVRLSMMMVGHTHEDIDQLFGVVVLLILQLGAFETVGELMQYLLEIAGEVCCKARGRHTDMLERSPRFC